jgi:SAM-dependent methyltransferase
VKALDVFLRQWRIDRAGRFIGEGASVLDVGTGDGAMFRRLKQIARGVGVDPDVPEVRNEGRYVLIPGRFPGDLVSKEVFDVITMLAVVEHLPASDRTELGLACARCLRPRGRVIVTVPSAAVDAILAAFKLFGLIDGLHLDEHHGFAPRDTIALFPPPLFRLCRHERFQLGLNHLFVFERM